MNLLCLILLSSILLSCNFDGAEPESDALSKQLLMDITIAEEDYAILLGNKLQNLTFPVGIQYNNTSYSGVIRSSGSRSRFAYRWSYRLVLDAGQRINNMNVFNLSAQKHDPTMLVTNLASYYYKQAGFPSFEHNHIFLRINGKDVGLRQMIEITNADFFEKRQLNVYELFKPGSLISFSFVKGDPNSLPNLSYDKKIPKDDNFYSIERLYYALDSGIIRNTDRATNNSVEQNLDIKQYLKYHAITSFINNHDAFTNNFFLWKATAMSPIKILPWDFDWAFNSRRDTKLYGSNAIIQLLLKDKEMFELYKLELESILINVDLEKDIFSIIDSKAKEIEAAYQLDPFLSEIYNFEEEQAKLKAFITKREAYFIRELNDFVYEGDHD